MGLENWQGTTNSVLGIVSCVRKRPPFGFNSPTLFLHTVTRTHPEDNTHTHTHTHTHDIKAHTVTPRLTHFFTYTLQIYLWVPDPVHPACPIVIVMPTSDTFHNGGRQPQNKLMR